MWGKQRKDFIFYCFNDCFDEFIWCLFYQIIFYNVFRFIFSFIHSFDFTDNKIGDEGVNSIVKALEINQTLQHLYVNGL